MLMHGGVMFELDETGGKLVAQGGGTPVPKAI